MKKLISFLLLATLIISSLPVFYADSVKLEYDFATSDKGFAEGTIKLTADSGTFWLYWANDEKALDGYSEIVTHSFSSAETFKHKMYERASIPVEATKLIAVKSENEPADKSVKNASAVYTVPKERLLSHKESDRKYRFASYSDIHLDTSKKSYAYDELHWRNALDTAAARNVDFIIGTGDYVNNTTGYEGISVSEWRSYQKIISESDYCNPIYEAIGNHELRQNPILGTYEFINGTGLDGNVSDKGVEGQSPNSWFAKDICGDHFIFMALEKGFNPSRKVDQFSDAQLDWLEGLLEKYSGDGKNIYILEHALFYKYGAGDRVDGEPYYSLPLYDKLESTKRFKTILQRYRDVIFLTGHTHISFKEQYNYSDNNNSSAQMVHNSSVAGIRYIIDDKLTNYKTVENTEGYIVDVFDDAIMFNGANLHFNKIDPNWCYIIKPSKAIAGESKKSEDSVIPYTDVIPDADSDVFKLGNVSLNDYINVADATLIQRYLADYSELSPLQLFNADVNGDGRVNIKDSTRIQKFTAKLRDKLTTDKEQAQIDKNIYSVVENNLELYYRYSSYDCYMALKKAFRNNEDAKTLRKLNSRLLYVVDSSNVDTQESTTVYYEDVKGWDKVYIYNYTDDNQTAAVPFPGTEMTLVEKNSNGNNVYKFTLPANEYRKFYFTNGEERTESIRFYSGDVCYYVYDDSSAKYKIKTYKYSK